MAVLKKEKSVLLQNEVERASKKAVGRSGTHGENEICWQSDIGTHRIGSRATVMVQSIAPGAHNTFSLSADTNEWTGRAV